MATIVRGELAIKEVQLVEAPASDALRKYLQPQGPIFLSRSLEPNEALP